MKEYAESLIKAAWFDWDQAGRKYMCEVFGLDYKTIHEEMK